MTSDFYVITPDARVVRVSFTFREGRAGPIDVPAELLLEGLEPGETFATCLRVPLMARTQVHQQELPVYVATQLRRVDGPMIEKRFVDVAWPTAEELESYRASMAAKRAPPIVPRAAGIYPGSGPSVSPPSKRPRRR